MRARTMEDPVLYTYEPALVLQGWFLLFPENLSRFCDRPRLYFSFFLTVRYSL